MNPLSDGSSAYNKRVSGNPFNLLSQSIAPCVLDSELPVGTFSQRIGVITLQQSQ